MPPVRATPTQARPSPEAGLSPSAPGHTLTIRRSRLAAGPTGPTLIEDLTQSHYYDA